MPSCCSIPTGSATVECLITSHARRGGKYTSGELPRGIAQAPYEQVTQNGVRRYACDDPYLPLHYPTINLAHYLNRRRGVAADERVPARGYTFFDVGIGIARAIAQSDRRVALKASGAMSHIFWPLGELEQHAAITDSISHPPQLSGVF